MGQNATNNLKATFSELTVVKGLRLVVLVCAYILIRKYVLQDAARRQEKQLEAEMAATTTTTTTTGGSVPRPRAKISPNQLRGGGGVNHNIAETDVSALDQEGKTFKYPGIPYDSSDDEDGEGNGGGDATTTGEASGAEAVPEWGKKARKRQRRVLRAMVDAAEKDLKEKIGDDEDKDIDEFLVDGDGA